MPCERLKVEENGLTMANINDANLTIAYGGMPAWVKQYYITAPRPLPWVVPTLQPNNVSQTTWNGYTDAQKGAQGFESYDYYSVQQANFQYLDYLQDVSKISYGTVIGSTTQDTASDSNGILATVTFDNTQNSQTDTVTIDLNYTEESAVGSSTSTGWSYEDSQTQEVTVGAGVQTEFFNAGYESTASNTQTTTIDSSQESTLEANTGVSSTYTSSTTVAAGQKLTATIIFQQQNLILPYTSPITISNPDSQSLIMGGGGAAVILGTDVEAQLQNSVDYGAPNSQYISPSTQSLQAVGVITNMLGYNYTVKLYNPAASSVPASFSEAGSRKSLTPVNGDAKLIDRRGLVGSPVPANATRINIEGADQLIGIHHTGNDINGAVIAGSHQDDLIQLKGANQTAYLFGGNDIATGTEYNDTFIANGDDSGTNTIKSLGGNDKITIRNGVSRVVAGDGDDSVRLSLDTPGNASYIQLGLGADRLVIDLKQYVPGAKVLVEDLESDDIIKWKNTGKKELKTTVQGASVEIFRGKQHLATIVDHAAEIATDSSLSDLYLWNIGALADNNVYVDQKDWNDELTGASALGYPVISDSRSFERLNRPQLKKHMKDIQSHLFDKEKGDNRVWQWLVDHAPEFESTTALVSGLLSEMDIVGKQSMAQGLSGFELRSESKKNLALIGVEF